MEFATRRLRFDAAGSVEVRRVAVFCGIAGALAVLTAGVIVATGGLEDGMVVGPGIPLAALLLPSAYMFSPAVASLLTRWLTGEGFERLGLAFDLGAHWRTYAVAWLLPSVMAVLGGAVYFLVFPGQFDPTASSFGTQVAATGSTLDPTLLLAIEVGTAVLFAPAINAVFAVGEELGWRAYLLPKLAPLGPRRAVVASGLIWGLWHWPILLLGYNYGTTYPGAPYLALPVFLVFTVATGTFLAWTTVRTRSVWAPALGHGAINAIAAVPLYVAAGSPNLLLGPVAIGLLGGIPWMLFAASLLATPAHLRPHTGLAEASGSQADPTGTD